MRATLLFVAGNRQISPFSGVEDQVRYLTLADSILQGRGFTYADQPTALRPPLYPFLLAGAHFVFGAHYLLAMRLFQFVVGIGIAYLCLSLASRLFGSEAGLIAFAVALALPTLAFINTELQTEDLAAFFTVLFLFFLLGEIHWKKNGALGMGVTSGLATLIRFNCAILPVMGVIVYLWSRRSLKKALMVAFVAGLIVALWIIRNAIVFHGKILFSSHGGINLLEGVLTPEGRAQKGESERLRTAVGWLHTDIEQNDPHRLLFPSEDQLDSQARSAAMAAWENSGWHYRFKLLVGKVAAFWISTDQLFDTTSFSPMQRRLRVTGVLAYWIVLSLALVGLMSLFSTSKPAASLVAFFLVFVTLVHLPFVMNTRLRIPFFDPLLSVLAGAGLCFLIEKFRERHARRSICVF